MPTRHCKPELRRETSLQSFTSRERSRKHTRTQLKATAPQTRRRTIERDLSKLSSLRTLSPRRAASGTANGTMQRLIAALLLAATHCQASIIKPGDKKYVSIIRPGDKYALDPSRDQCTTIIVGKDATGDGGPLTSHTNDCNACDFRLSKVPSKKTSKDEKRDVYRYRAEYPRYLGTDKGNLRTTKRYDWKHGKGAESMGTVPYDVEHVPSSTAPTA